MRGMTSPPYNYFQGKGNTMEVIEYITKIISDVGFPIACVAVMFYQMEQERKTHKEESDKWVEALNRNTTVMERVLERMENNGFTV